MKLHYKLEYAAIYENGNIWYNKALLEMINILLQQLGLSNGEYSNLDKTLRKLLQTKTHKRESHLALTYTKTVYYVFCESKTVETQYIAKDKNSKRKDFFKWSRIKLVRHSLRRLNI